MDDSIMQFLAAETGAKSYKAHKYGLDHAERPSIDYSEDRMIWKEIKETEKYHTYVPLENLCIELARRGDQKLTYFLDGSRRVYKVDDHAYPQSGGRNSIYPIIAGQIGVGCCKRIDKQVHPACFSHEIAIAVPSIANADDRSGFLEAMALKLSSLPVLQRMNIKINNVFSYSISKGAEKMEDRGTACIQDRMIECEKDLVAQLVRKGLLNHNNYLVKDGSLEYRITPELRKDERKRKIFLNNYNWVLGVSKNFNPEICTDSSGHSNPGFIADLPLYHRTPVALYEKDMFGDIKYAVWYIRLHDKSRTRTALDGILKVEKMLVTEEERTKGIDSELVDMLSALLINERNPVCYGSDLRWANHIYPVYLTETFVKSKYLSAESFLHLF